MHATRRLSLLRHTRPRLFLAGPSPENTDPGYASEFDGVHDQRIDPLDPLAPIIVPVGRAVSFPHGGPSTST